ncbi:MAG: ParA family protein [Thermoanaerobaculales bacterium]|jgi:chromosome partitioning protein|nr:ParA family protein [Thermoanaerobaculales bacterium]
MTHRIVLTSSKGGTGKTTTALNLAVALAERGRGTILVDLDPQGAIGLFLAKEDSEWGGLAEVMIAGTPPAEVVIRTALPNLGILPRGRIDPVDTPEYELKLHRSDHLEQTLGAIEEGVDFVLLDTPSGLGPVTRAALAVAHFALLPLQAEPVALRTMGQVLRVIDHVNRHENPSLQLLGILPTMVRLDNDPSLNVMSTVWSGFGGVFDTVIPRSDVFIEASEIGIPLSFLGGQTRPEARRFTLLSDEIEARINRMTGIEDDHEHRRLV